MTDSASTPLTAADSLPRLPTAKSLFSLHYLHTRLPEHAEWAADSLPVFETVRALWARARALGGTWNEAQTEQEFVKPVLDALGWSYIVQVKAQRRGGSLTRPDYALFASQVLADEAYPHQRTDDAFYGRATAIAEAKYWGRPLSQQDSSGRNTWKAGSNPSHQMVSYLVGTRCPWGILTNGRTWRLYSREVSSTASEFYEVDLGLIFDAMPHPTPLAPLPSPELHYAQERGEGWPQAGVRGEVLADFKRWWLIFRRDAFLPDARGRSFLQQVREGSATYARRVSDKLKELVFDEVMPEIANGFVAYRREQMGIREETDESLRQIYAAGLSLLYKLLFVLYAEARDLLPMRSPTYREQSLTSLAEWAAERADRGLPLSDATFATPRYEALLALFRRIDRGDPSLGLPRYDGGLFHAATAENQFLERHKLSDRVIARAVDIMVRDAGEPVDYAYLSVRNLGTIYEGLLENKLVLTSPPTPSPLPITGEERGGRGEVSLVNDKGERKLTGSFYTPDFIVEYIVSQTLDPILDERAARFAAAMDRLATLRRNLRQALDKGANQRLQAGLADAERAAAEAFLGIKVCDSAMGSGHFLVNTVDHLTDGIIRRMQVYHDTHPDAPWDWNPVQRLIERMRREILEEMARQGITIAAARLDDTALLTRLVMKRCIYGVDLNPLAVELAKLSLWLHTFTVGAPLSFLDHHLRWGNSVIGADVRTVERAMRVTDAGQFALFQGPFAGLLDLTAVMIEVAERADATLADVQQSAEAYAAFQRQLLPYKQALDLWVSQWFDEGRKTKGQHPAVEFMTMHSGDVLPALRGEIVVGERYQGAIARARELWERQRFFHWDLEFPEVFIDLAGRDWAADGGFDAMIGNPPYVRQEALAPIKPFLQANYAQVYHGVADLFVYFFGQGVRQLRSGGRLAYISSNSWLRANYAAALRTYLRTHVTIERLVDIGDNHIFEDAADVYPAIPVVRKLPPSLDHTAQVAVFTRGEGVKQFAAQVAAKLTPVAIHDQPDAGWQLGDDAGRRIFAKLMAGGQPLGEVVEGRIYYGVKTGLNEAFIVDQTTRDRLVHGDPHCAEIMKPILRGEDLRPWYQEDENRWLIFARRGIDIEAYPTVKAYLMQLRTRLEPRPASWDTAQPWPGRKPGTYAWYEIQDTVDYFAAFEKPKIVWPDIGKYPRFSWDTSGAYVNDKGYIAVPDSPFVLGILQSRAIWSCVSQLCVPLGERAGSVRYQQKIQFISRLPIPDAAAAGRDTIAALARAITEQARARYTVHQKTRHRIRTDLGAPGASLNQKLTAWWELDFPGFLAQVRAVLKREIPVRQRDDWESWLAEQRREHAQRTAEIVRLETQLNRRVYDLFDLTPAEIKIVEESTKYRYGEV
ncbi:Eco57I restriction-modification methylase domain-containing protein [Candidatus Amarolinea aalborgensis]|uniref:Eco57I restriction-modification methylase domain-containing protein n=1 Tax=Candidatus Amarolinea aalborgensis TaxID=2249329 RepID=UPI003BF9564A